MDDHRFDAFTRSLSSRRTALAGVLGSVVALLGLTLPEDTGAHNFVARCRKIKDGPRRRACLRRARAHNRKHQQTSCVPLAPATVCASLRRCSGTAADNCGRLINCTCPAGKDCSSNGSCLRTCVFGGANTCPTGCGCSRDAENVDACAPFGVSCDAAPQVCTATAECPPGYRCASVGLCGPGGTLQLRCYPVCPS